MTFLLLNQHFYPDLAASAQYLTDLAVELAERGHDVTVIASRRAYEDSKRCFAAKETYRGIKIYRIPTLALGKHARWRRAAAFGSFFAFCVTRLLVTPRHDVVLAMTSPPLVSFLGALFVRLKGGRLHFWGMDLNPDEAIAAGWLKEDSVSARVLQRLSHYSFVCAQKLIVLDRFMKERVVSSGIASTKVLVIPPWAGSITYDEGGRAAFRARYGLTNKFVVMYAGNHSPCHPLNTLIQAAEKLANHPEIFFCFVGGGSEQERVRQFASSRNLGNIMCLPYISPYKPRGQLSAALSAADMHVVVMGDPFVGIIHPCKVYNILATGLPLLYIGPNHSHITDLMTTLSDKCVFYSARHGEVHKVAAHALKALNRRTRRNSNRRLSDFVSGRTSLMRIASSIEGASAAPDSDAHRLIANLKQLS